MRKPYGSHILFLFYVPEIRFGPHCKKSPYQVPKTHFPLKVKQSVGVTTMCHNLFPIQKVLLKQSLIFHHSNAAACLEACAQRCSYCAEYRYDAEIAHWPHRHWQVLKLTSYEPKLSCACGLLLFQNPDLKLKQAEMFFTALADFLFTK